MDDILLWIYKIVDKLLNIKYNMEFLALLAIFYFFAGACICLLICVNPNDTGALGKMNRFVYRRVPELFSAFVRKIFGQGVLIFLGRIKHYLMQTNHPIVQFFYLLISVGGFIGYQICGIFPFMPNQIIGSWHVFTANFLAMVCFWTYYKACKVSPGQLNKENQKIYVKRYEQYYDDVIYKKNNKCKTCQLVKPARSKHCSICKMCVSKFDHHCIWIRQCVGQKNYKYFVSFLFMHSIWCMYLAVIGALSLYVYLVKMKIWDQYVRVGAQSVKVNNLIVLQFLLMKHTLFFFLIFMCAIMGVTLFIFVSYHFYLIGAGQTTNERVKKNDQIEFMKKEVKKMRQIEDQFENNLPKQIEYRGQKFNKKEFIMYRQDCSKKLAILQKRVHNPGFFKNLKTVFSQSDQNDL